MQKSNRKSFLPLVVAGAAIVVATTAKADAAMPGATEFSGLVTAATPVGIAVAGIVLAIIGFKFVKKIFSKSS